MQRRTFLEASLTGLAGATFTSFPSGLARAFTAPLDAVLSPLQTTNVLAQRYPFTLPPLGYANSAVEPAVDAQTMQLHHDKHHASYVESLNKALASRPTLHDKSLKELLSGLSDVPTEARDAVRNHGGGHANHALFWMLLAPGGQKSPQGALASAITRDFGSHASLITALKDAGLSQFGSGWAWLVRNKDGKLSVKSTPNQDTPISEGLTPVLAIDVWEHAYYLKYQNRREAYLTAVLGAMNWDAAGTAYAG